MSLRHLDDVGQITPATVLHRDVQYPKLSVYMSVVIAHDVFMVQVFQDIAAESAQVSISKKRHGRKESKKTHTSDTICFRSLSVIRSKFNSLRANTCWQ